MPIPVLPSDSRPERRRVLQFPFPIARRDYVFDAALRLSTQDCLERSRRLLLDTGDMVDPRRKGKPLKRCSNDIVDAPSQGDMVRPIRLREREQVPFKDIPEPDKREVLTAALYEYCWENGIEPASREYGDARELMIILYQNGHRTVAELKAALRAAIHRER